MKLELKNVKYAAFNSRDSSCFSASLYADDKRVCVVADDGNGSGLMYSGFQGETMKSMYRRLDPVIEHCKTLPQIDVSFGDGKMDNDIEIVVGDLFCDYMIIRDNKRNLKKYVVGFDTRDSKLYIWSLSHNGKKIAASKVDTKALSRHMDRIGKKNPDVILLNGLPESEIISYVRKAAKADSKDSPGEKA